MFGTTNLIETHPFKLQHINTPRKSPQTQQDKFLHTKGPKMLNTSADAT